MNYVSLCRRLAVCTALGISLSLPVGAVWNTMQPQLAYAEEYSSLRGNIIENAYLLVGTPFKMGGSFPSEGFDGSGYVQYVFGESGGSAEAEHDYRLRSPRFYSGGEGCERKSARCG